MSSKDVDINTDNNTDVIISPNVDKNSNVFDKNNSLEHFEIISFDSNSKARAGILKLPSGKNVETPFFMPVMTKGVAKNLSQEMLWDTGTRCGISNSFVLTLKPGVKFVKEMGGIHKLSNWKGALFTDSGGFQMLSKTFFRSIDNEGVSFLNPYQGKVFKLSPEDSMKNQLDIGSDVAMALDHVPAHYGMTYDKMIEHINRTNYWAVRCKLEHDKLQTVDGELKKKQLLFGINQGGVYNDLRKISSEFMNKVGFDGIAFGGFCFGESDDEMYKGIEASKSGVDIKYPIYIMGMGHPVQILESISLGCDCFDSTFPTMSARRGTLFTRKGNLRIKTKEFKFDKNPIEENCDCYTCKNYSRAYVKYLLDMNENFGKTLATIHNVRFMQKLLSDARTAIIENRFYEFKEDFKKNFKKSNENRFMYK